MAEYQNVEEEYIYNGKAELCIMDKYSASHIGKERIRAGRLGKNFHHSAFPEVDIYVSSSGEAGLMSYYSILRGLE